ncbi:MAG: response regulator [Bacteroidaceae bacterium]|nr:response regulator [Bacteroidaceae bacterium]
MRMDASKYTIMIVDDIPVNTILLEKILEKEGYRLYSYNNSLQAMEAITEIVPDILLLDIMMPGLDGMAFLKRLRSNNSYDNVRIIMVTAVSEQEEISKALALGANGYITKPISPKKLIGFINEQLSQISR